jgi:hypothetical protein
MRMNQKKVSAVSERLLAQVLGLNLALHLPDLQHREGSPVHLLNSILAESSLLIALASFLPLITLYLML